MKPISRRELIRRLRKLGFEGPYSGGKHPHMRHRHRPDFEVPIPNPHGKEIDGELLGRILEIVGVSREEWDRTE